MVFSSVTFLFYFLPAVLIIYFAVRKELKNIVLLLASLLFYTWGEGMFVLVLILDILLNYLMALFIDRSRNDKSRKLILSLAVILNLGLLFYYKYIDLAADVLNKALRILHKQEIPLLNVALPIGLSFFIFQGMSYVIDVYRKDVPVQKNPLNIALYIAMFPQLIAGPIVRYNDIYKSIAHRTVTREGLYTGTKRFITGLGKKVMIADILAVSADKIAGLSVDQLTPSIAWTGALCYTLQIYFDFSGYSDMAIGLGKIFGFEFAENFNLPYTATSISEFWRRWHISLSSWFRDYLYIPLGGNRKGNVYVNLLIVFLCTGLWHGADYCFVFWGLWHGFFIVIERALRKKKIIPGGIAGWIYTMLVVIMGWVFFQGRGIQYIKVMLGIYSHDFKWYSLPYFIDARIIFTAVAGIVISGGFIRRLREYIEKTGKYKAQVRVLSEIFLAGTLFCCIYMIVSGNYSPFIYFRF